MIRMPILFALVLIAAPAFAAPAGGGAGWRIDTGGLALGAAKRAWHAVDVGDVAAIAENVQGPPARGYRIDPSRVGEEPAVYGRARPTGMIANISARLKF